MIADIIAEDREGRPVLFVVVKPPPIKQTTIARFGEVLAGAPETVAFGMLVSPDEIRVFRRDKDGCRIVASIETSEVIDHYRSGFAVGGSPGGSRRVGLVIFTQLIEVWLWDLALPWKAGEPPKKAELAELGLLPLLEGGTTTRRGSERVHPLR